MKRTYMRIIVYRCLNSERTQLCQRTNTYADSDTKAASAKEKSFHTHDERTHNGFAANYTLSREANT